ncbi:MAG: fluoride efflux transporter CrcB [Nocardioidaceae bacterium]
MSVLLVFLGGSVGAVLRYFTDRFIQARHDMVFPLGTFSVNIIGSLILGLLYGMAAHAPSWSLLLIGTGFCGALTTFSTFSFETVRLLEEGSATEAVLNLVLSLIVGIGLATAGFAGAHLLF